MSKLRFFLFITLFLSSCRLNIKKNKILNKNKICNEEKIKQLLFLLKNSDLPEQPLATKITEINFDFKHQDKAQLFFEYNLDFLAIKEYYIKNMQNLGWKLAASFDSSENLILSFSKPKNYCNIEIFKNKKIFSVLII